MPTSKHSLKQSKEAAMYSKELKAQIGLPETATDAEVSAKLTALQSAATRLGQTETQLKEANARTAKAAVEAWERDGLISGNAAKEAHVIYAALSAGENVKPEQFAAFVAALPKIDTSRVAANVKQIAQNPAGEDGEEVTLDDFKKQATSAVAAKRIHAAVAARKTTNPKFTAADLRRELAAAN
jgi:hypothetical protein